MCKCGHEIWVHRSIPDVRQSGLVGECTKCSCEQYGEVKHDHPLCEGELPHDYKGCSCECHAMEAEDG